MKKLFKAAGSFTLASSLLAGALYCMDYFLPDAYQIEQRRGANVIYDKSGEVFVHSKPRNMILYLMQEEPHILKDAVSDLEKEVENGNR